MQKIAVIDVDNLYSSGMSKADKFAGWEKSAMTLTSCVCSFSVNPYGVLTLDGDLTDRKTIDIAVKLAQAVDKNSAIEIKKLKAQYGTTKEFAVAKDFLNNKAKQIWDVFYNRDKKIDVPREAMNTLGITNLPSLEALLEDSIRLFEKDGSSTTADIIRFILTNKNFNYTFEDVYNFLLTAHKKYSCKYNLKTVDYLIKMLDCDVKKLNALGIEDKMIKCALKSVSFKNKLRYLIKGGLNLSMFSL